VPKSGGRRRTNGGGKKNKIVPAATASRRLVPLPRRCFKKIDFDFDFILFYFLGVLRNFLAFWENGCIAPPFFEPCPYTLKC
jgi:hypothetical protein